MAIPTVTLASAKVYKESGLEVIGSVSFNGDVPGKVEFYLDPLPLGRPMGPYPVELDEQGNFLIKELTIGGGKWKARVVATSGEDKAEQVSGILSVNRAYGRVIMPLVGGGAANSVPPQGVSLTSTSLAIAYALGIAGASANKRIAGANVIRGQMQKRQRLDIYRDAELLARVEYYDWLTVDSSGSDVVIKPETTEVTSLVFGAGDLATGKWWFELQGGVNYRNSLRGTVGAVGSGKDMILSKNLAPGMGLSSEYTIVMPRSLDNVA